VRLPPALERVPHDSAEAYQRREAAISDDSAEASMRAGGGVTHDSAESWCRERTSHKGEWMPCGLRRRRPGTLYKMESVLE